MRVPYLGSKNGWKTEIGRHSNDTEIWRAEAASYAALWRAPRYHFPSPARTPPLYLQKTSAGETDTFRIFSAPQAHLRNDGGPTTERSESLATSPTRYIHIM